MSKKILLVSHSRTGRTSQVTETLILPHLSEPQPHTRKLGLAVLRGPTITLLSPVDGSEEIANPFAEQ